MTEHRPIQRDIQAELKSLRLSGMAMAWADLVEQGGNAELQASRWLIEHLLQAEEVNRHMRSIAHQTKAARFPVHRDLAGFNFEASQVDRALVQKLADLSFTQDTQNVVLIGGPGTGKTHLATALGISGLTQHGKKVRFYSTVDLVNALEQEKAQGKAGRIALSLLRMDLVILDEFHERSLHADHAHVVNLWKKHYGSGGRRVGLSGAKKMGDLLAQDGWVKAFARGPIYLASQKSIDRPAIGRLVKSHDRQARDRGAVDRHRQGHGAVLGLIRAIVPGPLPLHDTQKA
jgi:DNA replication protein DnaC